MLRGEAVTEEAGVKWRASELGATGGGAGAGRAVGGTGAGGSGEGWGPTRLDRLAALVVIS